jgi:hypothetical protein
MVVASQERNLVGAGVLLDNDFGDGVEEVFSMACSRRATTTASSLSESN